MPRRSTMAVMSAIGLVVLALGGCGAMLFSSVMMTSIAGSSSAMRQQNMTQGYGLSSLVPAEYVQWVTRAGSLCPAVTPPMIAAQIQAESNWDPTAVSPVGATGIAQFMPSNWGMIRDENGNGTASPTDPADEIVAQGRLMCEYASYLSTAYQGEELQRLTLAAYNIGPYKVLARGCMKASLPDCPATMPRDPSVRAYVAKIMSTMGQYASTPASLAVGVAGGPWQQPVTSWTPSGVFRQAGRMWRWCGFHTGYDYVVPTGTVVKAVHQGTVVHAGYGGSGAGTGGAYGNQVIIDHGMIDGQPVRTYYAHLSSIGVSAGQKVTTGQALGLSGATGNVSGPHLHLEMSVGTSGNPVCGSFVDPHAYIVQHANDARVDTSVLVTSNATTGAKAVASARTQLGVTYSYGGGGLNGPSSNLDGTVGFDCSSLVRFAWYQATGGQVTIPRTTGEQVGALAPISKDDLQPGDLLYFQTGGPGNIWSHVGMYLGDGQMIHAPRPGTVVTIVDVTSGYYARIPTTYRRVST